jgi:hypothetical protein
VTNATRSINNYSHEGKESVHLSTVGDKVSEPGLSHDIHFHQCADRRAAPSNSAHRNGRPCLMRKRGYSVGQNAIATHGSVNLSIALFSGEEGHS